MELKAPPVYVDINLRKARVIRDHHGNMIAEVAFGSSRDTDPMLVIEDDPIELENILRQAADDLRADRLDLEAAHPTLLSVPCDGSDMPTQWGGPAA